MLLPTADRDCASCRRALTRWSLYAACAFALPSVCACWFDGGLRLTDRDRAPAAEPIAEQVSSSDWLETLDQTDTPAPAPTPNGRIDDPLRPQHAAVTEPPRAAALTQPRFRKLETRHLGQWTARSPNQVDGLGFVGTDLGIGFAHRGQLWFLFGDSQSFFDYSADSLAYTTMRPLDLGALPKLDWTTRANGLFAPITVPGVDLGFMNVAVEGVSLGESAYVFLAAGWSDPLGHHRVSVLAHSDGAMLDDFELDHVVASQRFLNVSALVEGDWAYIWGSGEFRKSDVYLARVRAKDLADRGAWEYFHGDSADGPMFVKGEQNARPVVTAGCVGELSVRKHEALGLFLLAYNCESPRGVFLHTAQGPAGPYSEPITIFEPWRDRGYEHFIHVAPSMTGRDDGLSDPGREDESGGEYGPYLVPEWFTEEPGGGYGIVYTLSSWNPYQVHLMRTVLVEADAPPPALDAANLSSVLQTPSPALNLAMQDQSTWQVFGDGFAMYPASDGSFVLSSDASSLGTAATGTFWHDFVIDGGSSALAFEIQGGDAEVLLLADDEVVRRVHGRNDDVWRTVVFQLSALRERALRIALYDRSTSSAVRIRNLVVY